MRQPHRQLGAARMLFGVREAFVHAATGVECLRVGVFGRVNTAVFLFRIGSSIIDTGPPNRWHAVAEFLDAGPTPTDVFVTHHHEDHAGNAARISARYGARVWAPAAALPLLARPPPVELYRALVWGTPGVGAAGTSPYPDAPTVGAERAPLVAVPAPGHSVDHSLLHVPARGALFAADLYVAARPRTARFDEDVVRGLASLRHAAALSDSETLFCAHRGPLDGGARLLREKAAWLGELQSRATELYVGRGLPLLQTTHALLGREDALHWASGGDFARTNLVRGLLEGCLRPGDGLAEAGHRAAERTAHWAQTP